MTNVTLSKYELIQMVIDTVEEEYGIKAVDKVDAEELADNCLQTMKNDIHNDMRKMIETARLQASSGRSKVIQVNAD